jgi:tetratricopeptide (TPR) repeat protein/O-antigen ligase
MNYTTYLRWGVIGGLFLTLLVPFVIADGHIFPNLFFPYITGKNFIFRILVEIVAALYIILAIRDPKYRPRASWLMWAVLGFVAWMAIATAFSVDPTKSFWSNFERMEGYVGLLHLFVYFVVAGAILTADNLWERFFNTSIGASMVMGFYALFQSLHWFGMAPSSQSGARADTSFGNATYLAVYMLFSIFITLFMLARRGKNSAWAQSMYGLALVLQFTGLYLTETRGAFLGALGGIVIAAIWVAWRAEGREWKVLRRVSLGAVVVVVVLAGGFFVLRGSFANNSGILGRLASISLNDPTTLARLKYIWPSAFAGAAERPITGWGQENFSYVFNEHYSPAMWNQEQWFDRAHNQFLDWLVAGGFPAFVLYLALFALAAWAIIRTDKLTVPEQAALLGLLAAYAFNNLFVFDNLTSSIYFFGVLAFVHGMSRQELPARLWLSRPVGNHMVAIAAPVVIIVVAVGGWALNAPGMARASVLVTTLGAAQDPNASLAGYKQSLGASAWPGTPMGYQEVVEQLANYAGNSVAPSQAAGTVKQDYYTTTLNAAQALMTQRKGDARLELFISGFYSQFGQLQDALTHAQAALALSPGKQQILFQLGLIYLNQGDKQKALEQFKLAYDEAPADDQSLTYYAIGLYDAGDTKDGDALLVSRYGSTIVDNDQLVGLYSQLKMYDRVIAVWKLRVSKNPKDLNTLLSLASAYYQSGDKTNTIAILKQMEQINPAVAGQIEQLISQVENNKIQINAK